MLAHEVGKRVLESEAEKQFVQTCFRLGYDISRAPKASEASSPEESLLGCLGELVSGPVDADRLDYIERDCVSSGLELGRFDRDRIISSLRLFEQRRILKARPTTIALSAVEAFFLERYRNQRWLVFHHNVARGDVAIARSLDLLLEIWFRNAPGNLGRLMDLLGQFKLGKIREQFHGSPKNNKLPYGGCDEPWLLNLLREVDDALPTAPASGDDAQQLILRVCLGWLPPRQKPPRYDVETYRRVRDYGPRVREGLDEMRGNSSYASSTLDRLKPCLDETVTPKDPIKVFNCILTETLKRRARKGGALPVLKFVEEWMRTPSNKSGISGIVLLHLSQFRPTPDKPYELVHPEKGLVEMSKLSALFKKLDDIWASDINLHAFLIPAKVDKKQRYKLTNVSGGELDAARKALGKAMARAIVALEEQEPV